VQQHLKCSVYRALKQLETTFGFVCLFYFIQDGGGGIHTVEENKQNDQAHGAIALQLVNG